MVVLAVTMVGLQGRVMLDHEFSTGQVVALCGWIFLVILWSVLAVFYFRSSGSDE